MVSNDRSGQPWLDSFDADNREIGLMRVSLDRGLFKSVDVSKVSRGRFLTERPAWLLDPVIEFITTRLARFEYFLDPFAGEGHLLDVCAAAFGRGTAGYDIESTRWPVNDSLVAVPRSVQAMIVTNPPYLANHSAKRKGVLSLARDYYRDSGRDDLYKVALDRCLEAADMVVAIVPETILLSSYPKDRLVVLAVVEDPLFSDTDNPVAVACFDTTAISDADVYVGNQPVAKLSSLLGLRPGARDISTVIRFNDPKGRIGLRAVDAQDPGTRINFMLAREFGYKRSAIKVSSRLMTYVEVPGVADDDLPRVIAAANRILEKTRTKSRDLILAPFKGNNRAGVRRRRLDYAVARQILAEAVRTSGSATYGQLQLF